MKGTPALVGVGCDFLLIPLQLFGQGEKVKGPKFTQRNSSSETGPVNGYTGEQILEIFGRQTFDKGNL